MPCPPAASTTATAVLLQRLCLNLRTRRLSVDVMRQSLMLSLVHVHASGCLRPPPPPSPPLLRSSCRPVFLTVRDEAELMSSSLKSLLEQEKHLTLKVRQPRALTPLQLGVSRRCKIWRAESQLACSHGGCILLGVLVVLVVLVVTVDSLSAVPRGRTGAELHLAAALRSDTHCARTQEPSSVKVGLA